MSGAARTPAMACPACGEPAAVACPAVLSPWVGERIGLSRRATSLALCRSCGTGAFTVRYSPEQMDHLYRGYRDDWYVAQRHAWEPTYTRDLNNDFGAHPDVVAARQAELVGALQLTLGEAAASVRTVVDIGGDRGQFIPSTIERRYVLDVSGSAPVAGVRAVTTTGHARSLRPDLVMICGLLEHLSDPAVFLRSTYDELADRKGILIYIEVPAGVPDPSQRRLPGLAARVGRQASRWRPAWSVLDRLSATWRGRFGAEFPLMPLRQSEHLNFFSRTGLASMLASVDAEILLLDEYPMPSRLLEGGRVGFSSVLRALVRMHTSTTSGGPQHANG